MFNMTCEETPKKLSIVLPVFNEKYTVEEILQRIEKVDLGSMEKEIIIVDDCSTDGTREILKKIDNRYKVFYQTQNQGKGKALQVGFSNATGDYVIVQDADLEYDPNDYAKLLEPLVQGKADVVYGSRFLGDRPHRVLYFWHYIGNLSLTLFSNFLTNLNLSDMETGYKIFSQEVIKKVLPTLQTKRFGFEPEITAKIAKLAKKNQCRIYEVGISYAGRTYTEGKKVSWRDGIAAVYFIIKFNLFS